MEKRGKKREREGEKESPSDQIMTGQLNQSKRAHLGSIQVLQARH
jgi:hypothetical protein